MRQAMILYTLGMVTGVVRRLLLNCGPSVVHCGLVNLFIPEAFLSPRFQRLQNLGARGRRESGRRRRRHSRGTSMFQYSHGRQWTGPVEIGHLHSTGHQALDTLTCFIQAPAARPQHNTDRRLQTRHTWEHVPAIGGRKKKTLPLLRGCADRVGVIWLLVGLCYLQVHEIIYFTV